MTRRYKFDLSVYPYILSITMVHTTLSNSGYKFKKGDVSPGVLQEIIKDLTVKPYVPGDFGGNKEVKFKVFMESPTKMYVPRFYGQERLGLPSETNLLLGDPIDVVFRGSLRPEQVPIEDLYLKSARDIGGGLISLKCGGGKTVLALHIIATLKVKTIVVVHKDFLMTQWLDRIREFLPGARIGKIQGATIDSEDKDIVLAMVQSLSMKEYSPGTFSSFGLSIFDECHHLGAEVFHRSMAKVASAYSLGLSATPNRKDGLRKVFEWYIGPMVYMTTDKNKDHIETRIQEYYADDHAYCKSETIWNGRPCYPRMINNVCGHAPRRDFIISLIVKEHQLGRKILVLADRREYLDQTLDLLNQQIHESVAGLYVGGMRPKELRESQDKDIILGTFSMASEGMDIPKLNTIVLASPKSDVVQSVGRILREKADKRQFHPLVIDIKDIHPNLGFFQKQCEKRIVYYKQQNHEISLITMDGEISKIEKGKGGGSKGGSKGSKKKEVFEMDYMLSDDD
jgi:superfamily II DNA or RNA helicase